MFSADGIKDLINMMAERYGTVGRWASHLTLWLVVTAICVSALGIIAFGLEYLTSVFVGQGFLFLLFVFISFGIVGAVGGLVYFIIDKALEWLKGRKE